MLEKIVCLPRKPDRDALKIGCFAGLHGDEPAGTLACRELARWADENPAAWTGYQLHFFPECNPTGCAAGVRHHAHWDCDLNREFWKNSTIPEVVYLEHELRRERYDGIVALHSDDTSDGIYGFVSGDLLSEHVLEPALVAAEKLLPRNAGHVIDGFRASRGIIKEGYPGILAAPPEQKPRPLEIVFETPALRPLPLQVEATVVAVQAMLREYRMLLAYAQNL